MSKLINLVEIMIKFYLPDGSVLTEERVYELCDECLQTKNPEPLIRVLGEAFTQPTILSKCFQRKVNQSDIGNAEKKKLGKFAFCN